MIVGVRLPKSKWEAGGSEEDTRELADGIWLACMLTGLGLQTFADRSELKGLELQLSLLAAKV